MKKLNHTLKQKKGGCGTVRELCDLIYYIRAKRGKRHGKK